MFDTPIYGLSHSSRHVRPSEAFLQRSGIDVKSADRERLKADPTALIAWPIPAAIKAELAMRGRTAGKRDHLRAAASSKSTASREQKMSAERERLAEAKRDCEAFAAKSLPRLDRRSSLRAEYLRLLRAS